MDAPDCDLSALENTYRQFRVVNRLVAGWRQVYTQRLRPLMAADRTTTLLDIGSGGGDVARALACWAARDGRSLEITAVDPDERAHAFASRQPPVRGVAFRRTSSAELVAAGARFDLVTSNHLLHHLDLDALVALLGDSTRLATRLVVHNDIARSHWAYAAYAVGSRPFGRRSFISVDGSLSIRRSHTAAELAGLVGDPWRVESQFPARLLLLRDDLEDAPAGA